MTDPIEDYRAMHNILAMIDARVKAFKAKRIPYDAVLYEAIILLLAREMIKIGRPKGPLAQPIAQGPTQPMPQTRHIIDLDTVQKFKKEES